MTSPVPINARERGLCGARRDGEEPCTNPLPCDVHCGARVKSRPGDFCTVPPMPNGRCYRHGGASRAGIAHPNFRHGRRSKVLRGVNLDDYHAALEDTNIHDLTDELALTDALLNRLVEKIGSGDSLRLIEKLRIELDGFESAQGREDSDDAAKHLDAIGFLIRRGASLTEQVEEVSRLVDRRRKLADSHRRQLTAAQQMISRDQAMAFAGALVSAVRRHVTDPAKLRAIQEDFSVAIGRDRSNA